MWMKLPHRKRQFKSFDAQISHEVIKVANYYCWQNNEHWQHQQSGGMQNSYPFLNSLIRVIVLRTRFRTIEPYMIYN